MSLLALVLGLASGVAGCAQPIDGPVLELTLASPDKAQDINGPHVQHFAQVVSRLSEGSIRITPQWDVAPEGATGWDQTVARAVAGGTYDMGLVPGRAWDELGVESLRAMDTPFLVTDLDRLQAVLESDVRNDLLAGLPEAGVVGLDLFPSELRHPFGYSKPMRSADDFDGAIVRAPASATTRMLLEELGATAVDDPADPKAQAGAESSYGPSLAGIATGNVTFFPKTESLVMDSDVHDRLRDDQWELLEDAAAETRTWLFQNLPSDADSAASFCQRGGRIAAASERAITGLRDAGERVRDQLEQDPATRQMISAIEDLVAAYPEQTGVTSCPNETSVVEDGEDDLDALDGIYRTVVTARMMRAAGVTDTNDIRQNAARYVWTLDSGAWHYEAKADHYIQTPSESGRYTYKDGLFTFYWNDGGYTASRPHVNPDGTIDFRQPRDSNPAYQALADGFWSPPWIRISDIPE